MSNASEAESLPFLGSEEEGKEVERRSDVCNLQVHAAPAAITRLWRIGLLATGTLVVVVLFVAFATPEQPSEDIATSAHLKDIVSLVVSDPADCCSKWTPECYSTPGPNNKNQACKQRGAEPCISICNNDAGSRACQLCCTHFPDHKVDWQCDKTFSPGTSHGEGRSQNYRFVNEQKCNVGTHHSCIQRSNKVMNVTDCAKWCESYGLPGCCDATEECNFIWTKSPMMGWDAGKSLIIKAGSSSDPLGCVENQGTPSKKPTNTNTKKKEAKKKKKAGKKN